MTDDHLIQIGWRTQTAHRKWLQYGGLYQLILLSNKLDKKGPKSTRVECQPAVYYNPRAMTMNERNWLLNAISFMQGFIIIL